MVKSRTSRLIVGGAAAFGLFALTNCSDSAERTDRAADLGQAVLDQLSGKEAAPASNPMKDVPIQERAMAGTIKATADFSDDAEPPRRYLLGSIVAKPKDIPEMFALSSVRSQPELTAEIAIEDTSEAVTVVPNEMAVQAYQNNPEILLEVEKSRKKRSVTVIDPKAERDRDAGARGLSKDSRPRIALSKRVEQNESGISGPAPMVAIREKILSVEERLDLLPKLSEHLSKRAIVPRERVITRQIRAEDKMIEVATKFGLSANMQRSRSGQMKFEIGANALSPTQFTGENEANTLFAVDADVACTPENAERASESTVIAMACVIDELEASGEFEYVERDYLFEHEFVGRRPEAPPVTVSITPNDPLFDLQWHFRNHGEADDESEGGTGFVDFWSKSGTQGSSEVVVAVIDTGLQMSHPDIQGSANVAPGWDMVSNRDFGNDGDGRDSDANDPGDICPAAGVFENSFHGTHVAGTVGVGVTNNAQGVAGGAWNVKIVPVRALGKCGGSTSDINDAIQWAGGLIPEFDADGSEVWNQNPADIINLSIGLGRPCPRSMQDAIDAVTAAGVIVVVAAGNKGKSTSNYAPASCRGVVTVASSDARGHIASYSNYGAAVDLMAPGGDMSKDLNGDGKPDGVLSTKATKNCFDPVTGAAVAECFYAYEEGTSMAAPHVSAALALLKSVDPDEEPAALVQRLVDAVTRQSDSQCTSPCIDYKGAPPTESDPELCFRACGAGLLNLASVALPED